MKLKYLKSNSFTLLLTGLLSCGTAAAATYDNTDPEAKERSRSDYTQQGIRAGSFIIMPKLELQNDYVSNIYYRQSKVNDSYIAHWKPGVTVSSDWNRHALNFLLDTDVAQYTNWASRNDYQNVRTELNGRVDVTKDSHFDTSFGYNYLTERRASPDQISALTPTIYDTKVIDGFYSHTLNRLTLKTGVNATRWDYDNVQTGDTVDSDGRAISGTTLQMSTRSHWLYKPEIRLGYLIQPGYEAYLKYQYTNASYDTLTAVNGNANNGAYNRNSTGYNALAGFAFDLTGLITGDVSIGYIDRTYTDNRLKQVSGVNGFFDLKWRPTPLTTVIGSVFRNINETTQAGVSGLFATGVSLNAEHELLRNVNIHAGATFTNNDYNGYRAVAADTVGAQNFKRNDNMYGANVGAKYLFNRYLSTDLSYTYQNRDSNYANSNYEVNQVMLNIKGQY